jgi:hypothetical protein
MEIFSQIHVHSSSPLLYLVAFEIIKLKTWAASFSPYCIDILVHRDSTITASYGSSFPRNAFSPVNGPYSILLAGECYQP